VPDFAAQVRDLQADFQRIADRVPEVRACFGVRGATIALLMLGRPGGVGYEEMHLTGDREPTGSPVVIPDENAYYTELQFLTAQAGILVADILRSKSCRVKMVYPETVKYDPQRPKYFWLTFLLHTPPVMFHSRMRGPEGDPYPAFPPFSENKGVTVWIDRYPEVCVSALGVVKAGLWVASRDRVADSHPPLKPPPAALLKPDQIDLGGGIIVSDLSSKQLALLRLLKDAGEAGVEERAACEHLGYDAEGKGPKALSQLVSRTNGRLNDYNHLIERVNRSYCLVCTRK
jgi:hypothetical protein